MAKLKASKARSVLAENVRIERARKRLSQEALAGLAGVSRVYLGTIERGEVGCSIDIVERIASALNTTVSELLAPSTRRS